MADRTKLVYRPGCCTDKCCNEQTCMKLPEGKCCGDCRHAPRCGKLFNTSEANVVCDFYPRRFADKAGA